MKRKISTKPEPVVPASLLEEAKRSISSDRLTKSDHLTSDRPTKVAKCLVCGGETTTLGNEPLCWVCRRLKISAWREIEQQMPVQE
ncbi:MAG TPA: hypothetical protein VNY05_37960 [Candidatus Acidoferrales bacterium]|jgi:hypothetical protein|nr:hypothetical protein [Candidatus Acidoferrales bacterium]